MKQKYKFLSYTVASVSGTILAVCSCAVLPLFAGIGPATAFLYSGPAINILAIILTARILGFELGIARAIGAVIFSVIIGLSMHFIFQEDEKKKNINANRNSFTGMQEQGERALWKTTFYFAIMVGILIFAKDELVKVLKIQGIKFGMKDLKV